MNSLKNVALAFLLGAFLLMTNAASAGEGASSGSDMLAKVEAITVNLIGPSQQYIQVEMTLKLAKPELAERVKLYMPVIRHNMILLLTSKDATQLGPIEGKQKLVQEARDAVNQALERSDRDGVIEVLFSSFIIQ